MNSASPNINELTIKFKVSGWTTILSTTDLVSINLHTFFVPIVSSHTEFPNKIRRM